MEWDGIVSPFSSLRMLPAETACCSSVDVDVNVDVDVDVDAFA